MFKVFLRLAITLALAENALAGTTYYISKAGNDGNTGRSWTSAWRTTDKAQATLVAGDTLLFGTGDWYGVSFNPPAGGNANTWTVYACSSFSQIKANPAAALAGSRQPANGKYRVRLYSGTPVTGWAVNSGSIWQARWADTGYWAQFGTQCYNLSQGGNADPADSMLVCESGGLSYVDRAGEYYYDPATNMMYAWPYRSVDPNTATFIASRKACFLFNSATHHGTKYVRVWGLQLKHGRPGVVTFWKATDSVFFEHCHIAMGGSATGENAGAVMSRADAMLDYGGTVGTYNTLRACSLGWAANALSATIRPSYDPPISGGRTQGGAVVTYQQHHFYVDSCYIYGFCAHGVQYKNDVHGNYSATSPYVGEVVRYTTIANTYPIRATESQGAAITIMVHPDHDSIYGCIIKDCERGIAYTAAINSDPCCWNYKTFVANNSFYNCGDAFFLFVGHPNITNCGDSNVFKNNVMLNWWDAYDADGMFSLHYNAGEPYCDTSFKEVDHNIWYSTVGSKAFQAYVDLGRRDWTYWRNTLGWDAHGRWGDPGFADPVHGDFSRPGAASEIYDEFGGRVWTVIGAVQPDSVGTPAGVHTAVWASPVTCSTATIHWRTNISSRSKVWYYPGLSAAQQQGTQLTAIARKEDSLTIGGLDTLVAQGSFFTYRVESVPTVGSTFSSPSSTAQPDCISPSKPDSASIMQVR
jgi:hypothetical protein